MTSGVLGKNGGIDIRVGKNFGSDRAPSVIGDEEKRLEDALGKTMKK